MACQLIKHFSHLLDFDAEVDEELADKISRDWETMKEAGL